MYYGNCLLHHKPSPSSFEQHHWDVLVWLFKITMSPTSASVFTVKSKISMPVLPMRSGLAVRYFAGTGLFSKKSWREYVNLMQFILNLYRMSIAMSLNFLNSSPSTQCLHMCPPDQLPPASFTRLPLASTILMPLVERGNLMSSTLKRGVSDRKSIRYSLWAYMTVGSPHILGPFPIINLKNSNHQSYFDIPSHLLTLQKGYYRFLTTLMFHLLQAYPTLQNK